MRRLSRISRSNLELPDVSILKSESEMLCLERWWWVRTADICETESLFPVLGETPICSEIRVCICRRVWLTYNAPQHWHLYLYTKYSRLNHLTFIPALKRFFSFAFHTQANMVYKYAHNFTNYFQKLTHIFLFVLSFVLRVDCLTFFPFKDRISFAMRSHVVYKYKCQCCGALYVGQTRRHIRESQNMWEFRPKLEISFQSHKCLLFLLTIISPNITFLTLTLIY